MTHIFHTCTEHKTKSQGRGQFYIASLAAHTTLNIINLWKLALRGHLNTNDQARNILLTITMPLTTRPQLNHA